MICALSPDKRVDCASTHQYRRGGPTGVMLYCGLARKTAPWYSRATITENRHGSWGAMTIALPNGTVVKLPALRIVQAWPVQAWPVGGLHCQQSKCRSPWVAFHYMGGSYHHGYSGYFLCWPNGHEVWVKERGQVLSPFPAQRKTGPAVRAG